MRMNRRGMLAMLDAAVFVMIIMMASAVLVHNFHSGVSDDDAGDILDSILSSEVRMADLSDEGDGSLVRISDMIALDILSGGDRALGFADDCLNRACSGRPYLLRMFYGDGTAVIGSAGGKESSSVSMERILSTGGVLRAELILYSS